MMQAAMAEKLHFILFTPHSAPESITTVTTEVSPTVILTSDQFSEQDLTKP